MMLTVLTLQERRSYKSTTTKHLSRMRLDSLLNQKSPRFSSASVQTFTK